MCKAASCSARGAAINRVGAQAPPFAMAPQFAQFVANVAEKLDGFTGRDKGMSAAADEPPASSLEYGLIEERPAFVFGSAVSLGRLFLKL